ncbi:hypothetical protein Tco_0987519 [Tanacetum coccineum]
MSDLKFVDTHNLVAFLEKPTESEGFEEIVDLLNASPIKYALTVNPTIYYKKKEIITKPTIRRDLQLEDANGENIPTTSNDPLLSGEDRLKLTDLMDLCTNLQKKVLDLEKAKTAQDSEIASLKKKVKKLERRNKSRTPGLKRLRKVGLARRVESSDEASLGDQEDASKQGRKIADIDVDAEVTLIDETQGRNDDNLMFDIGVLDEQEVEVEKIKAAKPKVRGVMIQEPREFTTTTTTTTPAASKPSQDKGMAKMTESEKPLKKKDQIMYDQELVEGSEKRAKDSSKRAGDELEKEPTKKKGRNGYYEIIRVDGSAKTYLLFGQLLKEFDREDLETLWKLVKAKHRNTRPEEGYERVLFNAVGVEVTAASVQI